MYNGIYIDNEFIEFSTIEKLNKNIYSNSFLSFVKELLDPNINSVSFHTSGTTGEPKWMSFDKIQIYESAKNSNSFFEIKKGNNLLLCLPSNFVASRMMIARAMLAEANLIYLEPKLNPLLDIKSIHIDFAAFTPSQVMEIIKTEKSKGVFQEISKIIIGGGEIPVSLEQELLTYPNEIYATYGMTETLSHVAVRKVKSPIYYSIYHNTSFQTNDKGCLVIQCPELNIVNLTTTDIIELINHKSFIWKGRYDNVINSGGIKIYPEELERTIIEHNLLQSNTFYISKIKDNLFGEVPLLVVLDEVEIDIEEVNSYLKKYEKINHIKKVCKFEVTESGKIKRNV